MREITSCPREEKTRQVKLRRMGGCQEGKGGTDECRKQSERMRRAADVACKFRSFVVAKGEVCVHVCSAIAASSRR